MNTILKLFIFLFICGACKRTENDAPGTESPETENIIATTTESGDASANKPTRDYYKDTPEEKKLTQHQIDSIKTERGALITPPDNVGASLTPGSGKAVPGNDKPAPGTSANMGSSAKTKD